jgi:ankyrin repeat protein
LSVRSKRFCSDFADEENMRSLFICMVAAVGITFGSAAASDADPDPDPGPVNEFHRAVHVGDLPTVRSMLAVDPALATSIDEDGFLPIHSLDMYFDAAILDLLLAAGADINARSSDGITLLHIVTDSDAVSLLVQRGADIEAKDAEGRTPLVEQANNLANGPDVVAALLANGADPNAKGTDGETTLFRSRNW